MATAKEVSRRLKSLENLHKISDSLQKSSTTRLNRAKSRLFSARPYSENIGHIAQDLLASGENNHPFLKRRSGKRLYILINSDKGLCGAYNSNVFAKLNELLNSHSKDVAFVAIGRKGYYYLRRKKLKIEKTFMDLPTFIPYSLVEELADFIENQFLKGEYNEVNIISTKFINAVNLKPFSQQILPIEASQSAQISPFEYEPSEHLVLDFILDKYLRSTLYLALLESSTSEFAARMVAMDKARKSASDMIDSLKLLSNRLRQSKITRELADIIGAIDSAE